MGLFAWDVLNRCLWSGDRTLSGLTITYRHAGVGYKTRTLEGADIASVDRAFIHTLEGASIPLHRVIQIARNGKVVFNKEEERRKAAEGKKLGRGSGFTRSP